MGKKPKNNLRQRFNKPKEQSHKDLVASELRDETPEEMLASEEGEEHGDAGEGSSSAPRPNVSDHIGSGSLGGSQQKVATAPKTGGKSGGSSRASTPSATQAKPKRRRAATPVFDSDGEEVYQSDVTADSDDEEEEEEEDPADVAYRKFVPPVFPNDVQQDDTLLMTAALVGFFLSGLVAAALPRFGVPHNAVMMSGMALLLLYVLQLSFCTCRACERRGAPPKPKLSPIELVTPQMVFICSACLGTMLGGMIGGALRYVDLPF